MDADELPEDLLECLSNTRLSQHFREFGKEVGVADARGLEEVYKSHLETTRTYSSTVSPRHFLMVLMIDRIRDRKCRFC